MKIKAFTLMELIVVLIIVGILVSFGAVGQQKAVERAKFKQGFFLLRAMRDAEKMYYLKNNDYIACSSVNDCHSVLDIRIPISLDTNSTWTMQAWSAPGNRRVRVTRSGGMYSGCQHYIGLESNDTIYKGGGTCP